MPLTASNSASSTVTSPVGSQTKAAVFAKSLQGLRKVFYTASDLADPARLYQVISAVQSNVAAAVHALAENPTLGGLLLRGVVLQGGAATLVAHRLGRAYVGYWCAGTHGVAWSGFATDLPAPAFPGLSPAKAIVLTSPSTGTFDFWIF